MVSRFILTVQSFALVDLSGSLCRVMVFKRACIPGKPCLTLQTKGRELIGGKSEVKPLVLLEE